MIPDQGLIGSLDPQLVDRILWWAWFIAGSVACTAAMIIIALRNGPELTTQTDRVTGKKKTGFITWLVFFSSFTVMPPLIYKTVVAVVAAWDWLNANLPLWWVVALLLAVSGLGWWVVRKFGKPRPEVAPVPVVVVEPVQHPIGAFLPEGFQQWDEP